MNWDAIGAIAESVAAFAVIVSILYLARQVNQTKMQLQAQAEDYVMSSAFDAFSPVYEGRNADIFRLGLEDPTQLSESDRFVFMLLMDRQRGVFASIVRRKHGKTLTPEMANRLLDGYRRTFLGTAGGQAWLERRRSHLSSAELAELETS